MKRTMILPMIVVSKLWLVAAVAAADSFPITSPQQTDRSVMLAWETHQEVRTVRNSCQWNPSTPTGRTHDAAIVPGEGRGDSAAARIQGNRSEGNARGCFVQESEDEQLAYITRSSESNSPLAKPQTRFAGACFPRLSCLCSVYGQSAPTFQDRPVRR